jgi:hypothetical protein
VCVFKEWEEGGEGVVEQHRCACPAWCGRASWCKSGLTERRTLEKTRRCRGVEDVVVCACVSDGLVPAKANVEWRRGVGLSRLLFPAIRDVDA